MSTAHIDDLLADYASGALAAEEITRVEEHLRGCNRCQRELAVIDEAYASLRAIRLIGAAREGV